MKVGKYRLVRRLASGGMGEVWEGALEGSQGFARRVAIKRMAGLEDVPGWENMFLDEARIASQLHHANIVPVLDFGLEDGRPFQVLELIDGLDAWKISQRVAAMGLQLPFEVALHLCTEVAHALHYAHNARGDDGRLLRIVHRDVTPDNVLVSWEGDVKLSDFGIAKARDRSHQTQAGVRVGKPSYMAPEQATGGEVDPRTDVFMLGCVLQAILTGRSPLAGEDKLADLLAGQPLEIDPRLPDDIKQIVARAVRRSKADRYQDAAQLAGALGAALHARLKIDPRSALREFLQPLRPAPRRTGALDALLGSGPSDQPSPTAAPDVLPEAETAEQPRHRPSSITELEPVPAQPQPARWKQRALIGGLLGALAIAATALALPALSRQQPSSVPPEPVLPAPAAPAPPASAPQPGPVAAPAALELHPASTPAPVKPKPRLRPKREPALPAGVGVLLIGGPGAQRCEITVDGKSHGFAPKRLELEAGVHQVELITPSGSKLGPKKIELTPRHTESEPYRWLVE